MQEVFDKQSGFGALAKYARPELIPFEDCIWERAVVKFMPKTLVDTNVLLRYLLHDVESQQEEVDALIAGGVATIPEVFPEIVYVLGHSYKVDRQKISEALLTLLDEIEVEPKEVITHASKLYGETNLDYVDCVLVAYRKVEGREVFTFDKDLNKLLKREEK